MAKLKIITEEEPLRKKSRPITEITDRIRKITESSVLGKGENK